MNIRPTSWLDQLVGACGSLLVGALLLFAAVRLLTAIWVALVAILGSLIVLGLGVMAWRSWQRQRTGW